jgi:hypothetical protein
MDTNYLVGFLDFLARATGVIALILGVVGFMFREKWKQVLQQALLRDLEVLKADLLRKNAEHAATLVPQMEQIKHDFQQKLESYKVSLIAQTEAVKARNDLKKSIALRYAEVEFERLVALELLVAPICSDFLSLASLSPNDKTDGQLDTCLMQAHALGTATEQAEMFLSNQLRLAIATYRARLLDVLSEHIGPQKLSISLGSPQAEALKLSDYEVHGKLKEQIRKLGTLSEL